MTYVLPNWPCEMALLICANSFLHMCGHFLINNLIKLYCRVSFLSCAHCSASRDFSVFPRCHFNYLWHLKIYYKVLSHDLTWPIFLVEDKKVAIPRKAIAAFFLVHLFFNDFNFFNLSPKHTHTQTLQLSLLNYWIFFIGGNISIFLVLECSRSLGFQYSFFAFFRDVYCLMT